MVFDLTKRDSFENLNKWLFEVKNNSHDKIQTVVIGNKSDLKDKYFCDELVDRLVLRRQRNLHLRMVLATTKLQPRVAAKWKKCSKQWQRGSSR